MKKFMEKLKSFSSRVITILLIELLVVSAIPLNANAGQPNINNNFMQYGNFGFDFGRYFFGNNEIPLILSYSVDKVNGKLILSWNKTVSKYKKYYVLSRNKDEWKYELACDKNGIAENNWTCDLGEAMNKYFTVCEAGLPVYYGYGFFNPYYRYNMDYSRKSNQVYIDDNSARKPGRPEFVDYVKYGHEATLSWGMRDSTNISYFLVFEKSKYKNFFFMEKDYSHIDRSYSKYTTTRYYIWAIDKNGNASNPLIYESKGINDNSSNDNTGIDGVYRIDETKITTITFHGVKLEIPAGATPTGTSIAISDLRLADIEDIDEKESANITYSQDNPGLQGYEIYFTGKSDNKFLKDIKLSFRYDKLMIPTSFTEDDVYAFYYDNNINGWRDLVRSNLDTTGGWVTAVTNHFCEFYAGTMSNAGEPPQSKGINTSPVNIAAVNPMAGIRGINPPSPNNQGTANVGYPISVPAGINGMTPGVSIGYSSDAALGNCGYGWSLRESAIEIDTKRGAPKYDGTDKLMLDGRELVSIGSNTYRMKVEGSFVRVEKYADGLDDKYTVKYTNGSKLYYGETAGSRIGKYKWFLSKSEDKFGNAINYEYLNYGGNLYLSKITYGYSNCYTVNFSWIVYHAEFAASSLMSGYKIGNDMKLSAVEVKYNDSAMKSYELTYTDNFTLSEIKEKNSSGTEINGVSIWYTNKSPANPNPGDDSYYWLSYYCQMSDADINGDGLKDRIGYYPAINNDPSFYYVRLNTGSGYTDKQKWTYNKNCEGQTINEGSFYDMNGDGKIDFVRTKDKAYFINFNTGTGFVYEPVKWVLSDFATDHTEIGELRDMNGDGKVDRMISVPVPGENKINYLIQFNNGSGFSDTKTWTVDFKTNTWPVKQDGIQDTTSDNGTWGDMNGDGLSDRIFTLSYDASAGTGSHLIYLNNGNGFDEPMTWNVSRIVTNPVNTDLFPKPYTIPWSQYVNAWYDSSYGTVINSIAYSESISDINDDGIADRRQTRTFNYTYKVCYYVDQHDEQSFLQTNTWSESTVAYNTGKGFFIPSILPNKNILLSSITNTKTKTNISFGYTQDFLFKKDRFVLNSITTSSTILPPLTTIISYDNGVYDSNEKEFLGYGSMSILIIDKDKEGIWHHTIYNYLNSDQYSKGLLSSSSSEIIEVSTSAVKKMTGKQSYAYETGYPIAGNLQVRYMYPKYIYKWIYDKNGTFIGINNTSGDLMSAITSMNFDANGLPTGSTIKSYGDPYNTNDDTITTTTNMIDTTAWHCQAATSETTDATASLTKLSGSSVEYNTDGSVHKKTAWNNNGTTPVDPWVEYGYNTSGEVTSVTGSNGQTVGFAYDYSNPAYYYKIITKTLPGEMTEITRLDYMGKVMSTTDVYGDTTRFVYDTTYEGRLVKVYEQGDTDGSSGTYDLPSKRYTYGTEIIAGQTYFKVKAEYKDTIAGHYLLAMFYTDPLGMKAQTKVKSEVDGEMVWVVSGTTEYDQMGRPTKSRDIKTAALTDDTYIDTSDCDITGSIEYDDMSVPVKLSAKYNATQDMTIETNYDIILENNRLLAKNRVWDNVGHDSTVYTDMSGVQVRTETKGDTGTITSSMEYNLSGYAKLNEGEGLSGELLTGEKQYDSLGRLKWIKSPDAGRKEYFYKSNGLVEKIWDYGKTGYASTPKAYKEVGFLYDTLNRITNINYTGSSDCNIIYTYYGTDSIVSKYNRGNISTVTKGNGFSVTYNYEKYAITEIKTIEGIPYTTRYEYDIQGRIKTLTYPDGEVVTYSYNDGGSLTSIASPTITYISNIKYDMYGQKTSETFGNGQVQTYTYDKYTGLLDTFTATDKNSNKLLGYKYTFNMSGNITNIADGTTSSQTYGYDLLGRLTSGAGTYTPENKTYNETYSYDNINRITSKTGDGATFTYGYYNGTHAVESVSRVQSGASTIRTDFNYDDFGNMTKKQTYTDTVLTGTEDYTYNLGGELTRITLRGNYSLDFQYDAGGQRTVKTYKYNNSVVSKMVYVNGFYTIRNDVNIDKHISDGKYIIATKVKNNDSKVLYYSQNHIGSTAMLTRVDGSVLQRILYRPYGETWIAKGTASNDIERFYTGQVWDKESGLYYYNARYYSPNVGMFISADPMMDGANHYAYANCSPLRYNDPTGLDPHTNGGQPFSYPTTTTDDDDDDPPTIIWNPNDGPLVIDIDIPGDDDGTTTTTTSSTGWGQYTPTDSGSSGTSGDDTFNTWLNTSSQKSEIDPGRVKTWVENQTSMNGHSPSLDEIEYFVSQNEKPGFGDLFYSIMAGGLYSGATTKIAKSLLGRIFGNVAATKTGTKLLNPSINITEKGWTHVFNRHINLNTFTGKSKFGAGVDVKQLIKNATQMPMVKQANGNFARIVNAGTNIGIDRTTGATTNFYTVITNAGGDLITTFPGLP